MACSHLEGVLKLMNRLFIQFSNFSLGHSEPQITETIDTESVDTGDTTVHSCSKINL
jgi:hypothetical protein